MLKEGKFGDWQLKTDDRFLKHTFSEMLIKGPSGQGYGFSSGHVWCESWTVKKAEHRKLMLLNYGVGEDEKTLERPLDCKVIQPVHPEVLSVHWKD